MTSLFSISLSGHYGCHLKWRVLVYPSELQTAMLFVTQRGSTVSSGRRQAKLQYCHWDILLALGTRLEEFRRESIPIVRIEFVDSLKLLTNTPQYNNPSCIDIDHGKFMLLARRPTPHIDPHNSSRSTQHTGSSSKSPKAQRKVRWQREQARQSSCWQGG